ncbi:MAG: serine/threonine protein kinase [Myxococcaceae bacterium]
MTDAVQFGKYRLLKPLAQGGMAEIFLAKQQGPAGFEKTVVIKRVLPHLSSNGEFVQMFLDEARLAARLSHPCIVQIFDFGEAGGAYYLCMEHLSGEDLGWVVRRAREKGQPVPAQVAAVVVAAAASALHYAHTLCDDDGRPLHIVHRDISPSNLFLTYQGQVKVLDFGIAKAEGKLVRTHAGIIKGKVSYMSPEQAKGMPLDARSDVFALGAVLHELLTGKRLFRRDSELETLRAAMSEPIPTVRSIRPEVPEELDLAVMKALERDLSRRFQSAAELSGALDDYLAARTYVPVPTLLQDYLKDLVGEEEMKQRTRVPTGSKVPAQATAATRPGAKKRPESPPTRSLRASSPAAKPGRLGLALGVTAAAALVLAGGFIIGARRGSKGPPGRVGPLAADGPRPEDAGAPGPVVTDAPSLAAVPDPAEATSPGGAIEDAGKAIAAATAAGPARPARGTLDVNCVPWCRIYLNGQDTGRTSPARGISLAVGRHRLRVVNPPTGVEREKTVLIKAGAATREVVQF